MTSRRDFLANTVLATSAVALASRRLLVGKTRSPVLTDAA